MLDIKFIKENPNIVKDSCKKRGVKCDIDKLLKLDKEKREIQTKLEQISAQKNKASKEIARTENKKEIISKMRKIDKKGDKLKKEFRKIEENLKELLLKVPNILMPDVPEGKNELENKVLKKAGRPTKFNFKPKDHVELGEKLGIIDIKNAAKISGTRFAYLKGKLALLEFAIVRYVFDVLTNPKIIKKIAEPKKVSAKTFIPVVPPVIIKPDVYIKMARLSEEDKDEKYYLPKDDVYLVGSAEHTLGPLHMDEIIPEKNLPIRYIGFSTSFRREAGSYGKDTRGILRVHQFDKLEMESFTTKDDSLKEQNFIIALQEYLVKSLKIPYQLVILCTGDMGNPDARQIDLECWIPSQNKYRETHTSDLMLDYQSRRLNTRVKRRDGIEFVHMNDATAFAIGRIIIAIIENYQQKDGSIKIPEVLQKYTGFKEIK